MPAFVKDTHPVVPAETSAPSASTLGLKSYILWDHREQNQQKIPEIPLPLFSTTCSPSVVQTLRVIGNCGTSLRGTVKDACLEGHLNPWTSIFPASLRPILTVYSPLSADFQVSMPLFFHQREEV